MLVFTNRTSWILSSWRSCFHPPVKGRPLADSALLQSSHDMESETPMGDGARQGPSLGLLDIWTEVGFGDECSTLPG
jgi:hypothetical protein